MNKSIIDNLLEKAWKGSTRQTDFGSSHSSTPNPHSSSAGKDYKYDPEKQELSVSTFENGSQKRLDKRVLATTKENEKKLKNASLHASVDELLEKAKNKGIKPSAAERRKIEADEAGAKSPGSKNYGYHTITESNEKSLGKCHTHVLDGETEDGLKAKKKEAPKAKDHVFGNDPNDKRGSELEMVKKKEQKSYKSVSLTTAIDDLLEKAVYGAGASHGKVERGSGKDSSKPGTVRKPELSDERKKQLIEGVQAKAANQASSTGMHSLASKIRAEKSLDERTCDLVKSHAKVPSKFFDKPEAERKRIVGEKAWKNYDEKNKIASRDERDSAVSKIPYVGSSKSIDSDLEKSKDTSFLGRKDARVQASRAAQTAKENDESKNEMIRATHAHEKKDVYGKPTGESKKSLDADLEKDQYTGSSTGHNPNQGRPSHQDLVEHAKRTGKKVEKPVAKRYKYEETGKPGLSGQKWLKRTEKSLDERTCDLVKDLREGYKNEAIKQTGEDYDHKAEADYKRFKGFRDKHPGITPAVGSEKAFEHTTKEIALRERLAPKSLDERTCDLHKGFAPEKVGGAVGREYVKNPDSDKAKRVAVKFHSKNVEDSEAKGKYNEAMTNEVWKHDLKLAKKSLRDVVNMWQMDSPYVTKGSRVIPLGPGGEVQDLSKDDSEDEDNGAE